MQVGMPHAITSTRVRYVREFLALFPDESDLVYLNMRRAEGDALWISIGAPRRRPSSERWSNACPTKPGATSAGPTGIGCWTTRRRSTRRPRPSCGAPWIGRICKTAPISWNGSQTCMMRGANQRSAMPRGRRLRRFRSATNRVRCPCRLPFLTSCAEIVAAPVRQKLGRNDPCWCGSGLKYKRCHLRADRQSG